MRGMPPQLEQLVRRVDSPARMYPYMFVETAVSMRQGFAVSSQVINGITVPLPQSLDGNLMDTESGTVSTTGSTTFLNDNTKNWGNSRWVGWLCFVKHSGTVASAIIQSNTSQQAVLATALPFTITAGDTYVFVPNVEVTSDGGLRMKQIAANSVSDTTQLSWIQAPGDHGTGMPISAGSFLGTLGPPGGALQGIITTQFVALISYGNGFAAQSPTLQLTQILAYLHPQGNVNLGKTVATWRCEIFQVTDYVGVNVPRISNLPQAQNAFVLLPLGVINTPAFGTSAGWVTFDMSSWANRIQPKKLGPPANGWQQLPGQFNASYLIIRITGLQGNGQPASNIAWGFDNGASGVLGPDGSKMYGYAISFLPPSGAQPLSAAHVPINYPVVQSPGAVGNLGACTGALLPSGSTQAVPNLQLIYATHPYSQVIGWSKVSNYATLSPAPTAPGPAAQLHAETPGDSSVKLTVSPPNTALFPSSIASVITDGQFYGSLGGSFVSPWNNFSFLVTMNPTSSGDASPVLRSVGFRQYVSYDLSDVCEVEHLTYAFDPITHKVEIPELVLKALHDGEPDMRDTIRLILSQNPIGNLYVALYCGHPSVSNGGFMKIDNFLIDRNIQFGAHAQITGVNALALIRGALPKFTPEVDAWPNADAVSGGGNPNPGGWSAVGGVWGTNAFATLADGDGINLPPWDDTTGIESPSNPSNLVCWTQLSGVGTPTQLAGVQLQVRLGIAVLGQTLTLEADLYEGSTQRTGGGAGSTLGPLTPSSVASFNPANWVNGASGFLTYTYNLTPTQVSSIANWSNLFVKFTANGTGQILIAWARLAILGLRAPLVYASLPIEGISALAGGNLTGPVTDILANQAPLDARYRTQIIPAASQQNSIIVAKTITGPVNGGTDIQIAKAELDALCFIQGVIQIGSQGRLKYPPLYDVVVDNSQNAYYTPHLGPLAAIIPTEEIAEPIAISAGYEHRVPEWFVPFGWSFGQADIQGTGGAGSYFGETYGASSPALLSLGDARVEAVQRCPDRIAQWIPNQGIANGLAARHTTVFGLGLLVWRFRTTYAHPELELGDMIAIQTERFFAFDPIAAVPIAGLLWAIGFVCGVYNVWGRDLAIWIPTYSNLVGGSTFANSGSGVQVFKRHFITNGDFKQQWAFWTSFASGDTMVPLGNGQFAANFGAELLQCVRPTNVQDPLGGQANPLYVLLPPGAVGATLSGSMTAQVAAGGHTVTLQALFYDTNQAFVSQANLCSTSSTSYVTVTGSTIVPARAAYVILQMIVSPITGNEAFVTAVDAWI